jgi:hypothetical protein
MVVTTRFFFFIHMNVKEFKLKIHWIIFLNLSFDLGPFKVGTYCIKNTEFCKGLSKGYAQLLTKITSKLLILKSTLTWSKFFRPSFSFYPQCGNLKKLNHSIKAN